MDTQVKNTPFETRPLNTNDVTVMSHVTSIVVQGERISKLPSTASDKPGVIHLSFAVKDKKDEPCILSGAEELSLVLDRNDAVELGLLLLEMELTEQTPEEAAKIKASISRLLDL